MRNLRHAYEFFLADSVEIIA